MRRESTSSETASIVSFATTCSISKQDVVAIVEDASPTTAKSKHCSLRQKARRVLVGHGGTPDRPPGRKDGKRTLNFADPGGLIGDALMRPGRI
ncbi:hypothetical protein NQ176_g3657 [Zarea fungicola]|uniref:Uncharacterized protein n=1 Tax=Zarea fungicola TaxID=93591 RepID=A0ACC1NHB7_9HYPO|nr:hypothetical protein NQ176_g3657 [Lecanicillium fungicola]